MTQFRSIESIPVKGGGGKLSGKYESTKIRNHEKLETTDINNHILPGQFFPQKKRVYNDASGNERELTGDDQDLHDLNAIIKNSDNFPPFATKGDTTPKTEEYTVKPGDSLGKIAKLYDGVSYQDIQKTNNIADANLIQPGQKLKIPDQTEEKSSKYGYLRNILINTKLIKKAFGGDETSAEPINVYECIEQLFDLLNADLDFWNFDIVVDEVEDFRAKIIDTDTTLFDFTKGTPSQQRSQIDSVTGDVFSKDAAGSKLGEGVFFFPVWRIDSFIKSQNITSRVPNSMQLAVMFGSNIDQLKEFSNPGSAFGDKAGVIMGGLHAGADKDKNKQGLDIAYRNPKSIRIGAKSGNASQPLTINGGDDIFAYLATIVNKLTEKYKLKQKDLKKKIKSQIQAATEQKNNTNQLYDNSVPPPLIGLIPEENLDKLLIGLENLTHVGGKDKFKQLYNSKFEAGRIKDEFIQSISYYTTLTGEQKQTNRSTFIPLEIELTVDGIGGIYPGNSFHSTYLPKNYQTKAIFQMFEVNHTVDSSGWSVSFNGKMRATANSVFTKFDSLGEKVKKQLDGIVKKTLESTDPLFTGPPTPPYKNTNKKAAEVFTDFVTTNMHDVVKPAVNQAYEGVKSSVYGFFQKAGGLFGRDGEPVDVTNEQYELPSDGGMIGAFRDNSPNFNKNEPKISLFGQTPGKDTPGFGGAPTDATYVGPTLPLDSNNPVIVGEKDPQFDLDNNGHIMAEYSDELKAERAAKTQTIEIDFNKVSRGNVSWENDED